MINLESTDCFSEGYVTTSDNFQIYYKKLKPENPTKNVVIVPGFGATATMFLGMQHFFYEKGYCTIILEMRGHGFSDGIGGYVENYSDYLKDIDQVVNEVTEKNIPVVICGHSNGGLASINYVTNFSSKVESVILFSPWLALSQPLNIFENIFKNIANILYSRISLPMGKRGADPSGCTTNPIWQKILKSDKQIHTWSSVGAINQVELTQKNLLANANKFKQPVMIIHAVKDPVTSYDICKNWYNNISSTKKRFITLSASIHHPFLETNIKQTYLEIYNFISGKI